MKTVRDEGLGLIEGVVGVLIVLILVFLLLQLI